MRKSGIHAVTYVLLLCLLVWGSAARGESPEDLLQDLVSADRRQRDKAAESIRKGREKTIAILVAQVERVKADPAQRLGFLPSGRNTENNDVDPQLDAKYLAIMLLGELRATEAIPTLLDNLDFKNPRITSKTSRGSLYLGDVYPAAEALRKIGAPAVDPLIDRLGAYTDHSGGRRRCCFVLKHVLGNDMARARLQLAIERAPKDDVKRNLSAALVYFDTK
jgi:hypothetical protein